MTSARDNGGDTALTGGMYRRLARNSALLASATAISSLLMMLAVAIAARALTARDFGVLVLLQSAVLMLRAFMGFATQQPVIKLGSDAQHAGDKQRLGDIISMGLVVDVVGSVAAFVVAALFIELSRSAIGLADQDVGSAWILAFSLLLTGYPTSNGIFRLYNRFGLLSLVQSVSAAALLIAFAIAFAASAGLQTFVWIWAIYLALSSFFQLLLSLEFVRRDQVPLKLRIRPFWSADGNTLLHYCWTTWGTSTADTIRTNGDSLMVGAMVSVQAAGVYSVARQLAGILRKFNVVYSSTVFPEITRLSAQGDLEGARKLKARMTSIGLVAGVVSVALAALLGEVAIKLLFGARFAPAYLPFVILTAAAIAQLLSFTPSMYVQVYRGPRMLLLLITLATAAFAGLAVVLTLTLSIAGMAIAHLLFAVILILLCELALRGIFGDRRGKRAPVADELQSEEL